MPVAPSPLRRPQQLGLWLAGLMSLLSVAFLLIPAPSGDEVGPPQGVLVLSGSLGVVGLVAAVVALRTGNRRAVRVAAGALVLNMLTAVPALFVDVAPWIKATTAAATLLTLVVVVLLLRPSTPAPAPARA